MATRRLYMTLRVRNDWGTRPRWVGLARIGGSPEGLDVELPVNEGAVFSVR
ncbi:hypothetical protein ACIQU6_17885 [Streptomyces sp. NPDC090442]|uniref:hypothetical protein n=1 Tax=Streptomyces sp. NPDC090442 TaxID=3365962 RepID=UPI0038031392